jgi:molybdopterin molybdotransferase
MLEVQDALARLLNAVSTLPPVELALEDAQGLTLAEAVTADRDAPATDRSAMDGFAVRAADCDPVPRTLAVRGEVRAGEDPGAISVGAEEAVRIFTGAPMPRGADAVVMVELTEEDRASATVVVKARPEAGQHIRRRGEERRAGEPVLSPGARVRAAETAPLAALGKTRVRVVRLPQVAVVSTGDEVVEVGALPAPHQVRNSNAAMVLALLARLRVDARSLGIAGDVPGALDAAIAEGCRGDLLLLSGGVSVGAYDLVESALTRAGCEVLFHNVAMRPGKPILAAKRGACLVLGLPGNPVSAFTSFQVFVAPVLRRLMGASHPIAVPVRATLVGDLKRRPGRLTYHLAHLAWREGMPFVAPVESASSGDVLALAHANAFIVAPGDTQPIPAGEDVEVLPWD